MPKVVVVEGIMRFIVGAAHVVAANVAPAVLVVSMLIATVMVPGVAEVQETVD